MRIIYLLICFGYLTMGTVEAQIPQTFGSTFSIQISAEGQQLVTYGKIEQKKAQIKLLRQQVPNREEDLTSSLLIGGVLLLVLSIVVTAWLRDRARLRRLEVAQALRKQIVRDLHDEVDSTLSSLFLLSGTVDQFIARNKPESVEQAIQKINTDARRILEAMNEIIWTLNPENDSLLRIAIRLQTYAQPLMESTNIRFSLIADPTLDTLPISGEVRRNLYLIGKEAINNLVRYSEATWATMRFEHQKNQLKVVIEDNGKGFNPARFTQRTGQLSVQERAQAIGAILAVKSRPGQGTLLQLTVYP